MTALRAPFPYFGGKSRVAPLVWSRLGDVRNYVEPFCGSMAMVLGRPHYPFAESRIETVNDADCFVANFWRALQADPETVAHHCDWPVNEADLHARHLWLVNVGKEHVKRLRTEPEYFDAKIAGWWVWGACQWIGSGWCHHPEWEQLPHLGDAGMDVHRPSQQLPHLGDAGRGVHRPSQKRPNLGNAGRGDTSTEPEATGNLAYLLALAERIRRIRVCCGDWSRVCGPTPTVRMGLTGVFLDPPYADTATRKAGLYAVDSLSVAHDVREWCIANGDDPRMRIALAGYEGEHVMPETWECVAWKAAGGYASRASIKKRGVDNSTRERIWFSPHCLKPEKMIEQRQMELIAQ